MADYIKREDAINAVESLPTWWADEGGYYGGMQQPRVALLEPEDVINAIKNIPSADVVEAKHGKWVEQEDFLGDTYYDCSCCGESFCLIEGTPTDNMYNFCPNCGAKMDGGT